MNVITILVTLVGLILFEVVSSIDNAVINAEVLGTMRPQGRRWFLTWGLFLGVVVVRGVLPWLIIWLSAPSLGPEGAFLASFKNDTSTAVIISHSEPLLLMGGGIFLLFLFLHWFFLEYTKRKSEFYAASVGLILILAVLSYIQNGALLISLMAGVLIFTILATFKQSAEKEEEILSTSGTSDARKLLYLELIDAVFSIDGVFGAFAFTFSVPLILLGNGIGALVVRQLTIGSIEKIKRYSLLKNGAMYSVAVLGIIMLLNSLGLELPEYLSPLATILIVGYFFYRSFTEQHNLKLTIGHSDR